VRIPAGVNAGPVILEVEDCSVVTSGSYERFIEIDGKRYQHLIDARTGWPAESDLVSATVVSPSSLQADLLATTALLSGSAGIDALRGRHPGCCFTVF
jgi:thiamine biosynthesis lipoprotein